MALFAAAFAFLAGDLFATGVVVVVVFLVVFVSIIVVVVFISGVSVDGIAANGVAANGVDVDGVAAFFFAGVALLGTLLTQVSTSLLSSWHLLVVVGLVGLSWLLVISWLLQWVVVGKGLK